MNKRLKLIYLVLLGALNYSCVEDRSTGKETDEPESVVTSRTDTLKFTSGIRSIFQDSKGNHWFGSLREGVALYNGKDFIYFSSDDGLTDNQIHSIQEDKEGIIWFNTQQGVSSYDGTRITNHTDASPINFHFQGNQPFQGKWMKSEGDLWFEAGNREGVYRYDGRELDYLAFPPQKVLNPHDNLFAVTDISPGKNNMIWFGTYAGVFGYNGSDFTIIDDESLGLDREIEPLHIRSIYEDSKGRLWMGNNGIGVLLKDGDSVMNFSEKHQLIHPKSKRNGDKSPPGTLEHVFTIAEDKKGNIWFGDRDTGAWMFDGKEMKNFTLNSALNTQQIWCIYEDRSGNLLFASGDRGIYKFNGIGFDRVF